MDVLLLQFFDISWNGNTPSLTHNGMSYATDAGAATTYCSNSIYQMAFDWGGNLVCAGKNVGIYSIPTNDNQSTTPAKSALLITKGSAASVGDVNCDGEVNIADVQAIISIILGSASNHATSVLVRADVDRNTEINISDINRVINIIQN